MKDLQAKRKDPMQYRSKERIAVVKDAAISIFTNHDYNEISMAELAYVARMSRTSLYRYYDNIDAVAEDLFNDAMADIISNIKQPYQRPLTPSKVLKCVAERMEDFPPMALAIVKQSLLLNDTYVLARKIRVANDGLIERQWCKAVDIAAMFGAEVADMYVAKCVNEQNTAI